MLDLIRVWRAETLPTHLVHSGIEDEEQLVVSKVYPKGAYPIRYLNVGYRSVDDSAATIVPTRVPSKEQQLL